MPGRAAPRSTVARTRATKASQRHMKLLSLRAARTHSAKRSSSDPGAAPRITGPAPRREAAAAPDAWWRSCAAAAAKTSSSSAATVSSCTAACVATGAPRAHVSTVCPSATCDVPVICCTAANPAHSRHARSSPRTAPASSGASAPVLGAGAKPARSTQRDALRESYSENACVSSPGWSPCHCSASESCCTGSSGGPHSSVRPAASV